MLVQASKEIYLLKICICTRKKKKNTEAFLKEGSVLKTRKLYLYKKEKRKGLVSRVSSDTILSAAVKKNAFLLFSLSYRYKFLGEKIIRANLFLDRVCTCIRKKKKRSRSLFPEFL